MLGTTVLNKWHYGALGFCLSLSSVVQADISGSVFRDFNANGSFDNSASFAELGVAGVSVKAFDSTGAVAATATSNSSGAYTLTGLTAAAPYRLEFTWADTWLKPGTASGGSNAQFVKDGVSNANLALSSPDEYSQDN
ncbi:MAG TPA: SdrD B-like domain-containing protein, partial [Thiolinea sp.]|nr:SdrD B-like domain-containing protein [Thiolinea sp.]